MGCDIHGYVEQDFFAEYEKQEHQSWYSVVSLDMVAERNYKIFNKLFGVRGDSDNGIAYNRGLPKDEEEQNKPKDSESNWDERPNSVIDLEKWGSDAHSVSYIYWDEIKDVLDNDFDSLLYEGSNDIPFGWKFVFDSMKRLAKRKGSKGVRMVVWFDC